MRTTLVSSVSTIVAVSTALLACGGAPPPPPPEPPHAEAPAQPEVHRAMKTKSELGSIDPGAVKKAFTALDGVFMDCQKKP